MNNAQTHKPTDVIIVGAGPIGLSMAKALSGAGLSISLVERQPQDKIANPAPDGREIAVTHRTKALLQDLHIWQRFNEEVYFLRRAEVYNGDSSFALGFNKPDTVHGKHIETLGYLVSNYNIRQASYAALSPRFGVDVHPYFDSQVVDTQITNTYASVTIRDNATNETSVLRGRLIIGADSRLSFMRKALGISADMHDFGRTVLVLRTTHTQSNRETAHEGFYYGKTLAVLPLGELQSSMVITASNAFAEEIKAMNSDALAKMLESWLGGQLGTMTVTSEIFSYPLVGVHARRFYAKRAAIIGDAAVGMHPVTAHGYNLGMESVQILSDQIIRAHQAGKDIAHPSLLRHYSHKHSLKTRPMYHGTNAIVKLYTAEALPAKAMRHAGLRLTERLLPIKKLITGQLTG